jgi:predicted GIY-YIG superfamily endonuclease
VGPLWCAMNERPRREVGELRREDIPTSPGVYAWYEGGKPIYVGKGEDLQDRIWRNHLGRRLNLTSSALRRNVAEDLGIGSAGDIKAGRCRPTAEQVEQVNARIRACTIAWTTCESHKDAMALETRLKREWMPPLTKR